MSLLEIENVHFGYQGHPSILRGASLTLAPGEQIAIVGGNGEGKSTLLKIAAQLLKPTHGYVSYTGRSNPALLLQNPIQQLLCASAREEIEYTLRLNGCTDSDIAHRTNEQLERFGLLSTANLDPKALSGGQQQKLALAALLCREFDLLLLDEPDAFLDGASRREFRRFFFNKVRAAAIWIVCRNSELPIGLPAYRLMNGTLAPIEMAS